MTANIYMMRYYIVMCQVQLICPFQSGIVPTWNSVAHNIMSTYHIIIIISSLHPLDLEVWPSCSFYCHYQWLLQHLAGINVDSCVKEVKEQLDQVFITTEKLHYSEIKKNSIPYMMSTLVFATIPDCIKGTGGLKSITQPLKSKDLGHFWLGYIRMLGHLQLSAHWLNFERLWASPWHDRSVIRI